MVYVKMGNCILVVNDSSEQFTFLKNYFKLIVVHVKTYVNSFSKQDWQ